MKFTCAILLIIAGLLAACGSAAGPETGPEQSQPNSPMPTPPPPEQTILNSPIATPAPANSEGSPSGDIDLNWDENPDHVVVAATFCCGFVQETVLLNYIADARIWGDGRIMWVEEEAEGQRAVLEGKLTPEQLSSLLQQIAAAGFFEWQEQYRDETIADAAEQCLLVQLTGRTKQVCEYVTGAPVAFHDLYATIAGGAGAAGTAYTPQRGYLTAMPLELPPTYAGPIKAEWPADRLGISLDQATKGVWVEDDTAAEAWRIVNLNWRGAIVQEGENYYTLALQLPGLSKVEPPTP